MLRAKSDMFFEELSGYSGTAAYMPNGGAVGGNFITQTFNSLVRRRRNSVGHSLDNRVKKPDGDNVSLSSRILSKLKVGCMQRGDSFGLISDVDLKCGDEKLRARFLLNRNLVRFEFILL